VRFAPYWARVAVNGEGDEVPDGPFISHGWSLTDPEEAHAMALQRAQRVRRYVNEGTGAEDLCPEEDYYPTDGDVLREVVLREGGEEGAVRWAVTRNIYGAEVLNVEGLAILDVDLPVRRVEEEPKGFFGRLFGRKKLRFVQAEPEEVLRPLLKVLDASGLGGKVLRTHSGFRVMVLSQVMTHDDPAFVKLMADTGTDRLYAALCARQACCRARLTPKPWRMDTVVLPPLRSSVPWPWRPNGGPGWSEWLATYNSERPNWAVAHVETTFGPSRVDEGLLEALAQHDACVGEGPLA